MAKEEQIHNKQSRNKVRSRATLGWQDSWCFYILWLGHLLESCICNTGLVHAGAAWCKPHRRPLCLALSLGGWTLPYSKTILDCTASVPTHFTSINLADDRHTVSLAAMDGAPNFFWRRKCSVGRSGGCFAWADLAGKSGRSTKGLPRLGEEDSLPD